MKFHQANDILRLCEFINVIKNQSKHLNSPENSCGIKTLFFRAAPFFALTPWKILRFRKYRWRRKSSPFGCAESATSFDLFVTLLAVLADAPHEPFELADCIVPSANSFFIDICTTRGNVIRSRNTSAGRNSGLD